MKIIEEQLKELILSQFNSLRDFSIKIDMPYSTMDSIIKRGVNNANVTNIIKISNVLGISTDDLDMGKIVKKSDMIINYDELTQEEQDIIKEYRAASGDDKETVKFILKRYKQNLSQEAAIG